MNTVRKNIFFERFPSFFYQFWTLSGKISAFSESKLFPIGSWKLPSTCHMNKMRVGSFGKYFFIILAYWPKNLSYLSIFFSDVVKTAFNVSAARFEGKYICRRKSFFNLGYSAKFLGCLSKNSRWGCQNFFLPLHSNILRMNIFLENSIFLWFSEKDRKNFGHSVREFLAQLSNLPLTCPIEHCEAKQFFWNSLKLFFTNFGQWKGKYRLLFLKKN